MRKLTAALAGLTLAFSVGLAVVKPEALPSFDGAASTVLSTLVELSKQENEQKAKQK